MVERHGCNMTTSSPSLFLCWSLCEIWCHDSLSANQTTGLSNHNFPAFDIDMSIDIARLSMTGGVERDSQTNTYL